MTRAEHLQWCKDRALEYLEHGDLANAMVSMMSDMDKHPETKLKGRTGGLLMELGTIYVVNRDVTQMKRWIEGFN